jgi:conjugative relaxase-like TrwC/TraI family protein
MYVGWSCRLFCKPTTLGDTLVHLRPRLRLVCRGAGVLSVAKLTLGQEAYYEQQVAGGLDDYYAGRGESPGLWAGSGADGLGLAGVVEDGHLGMLLRGVDPASGAALRAPARERTITARRLDTESGEWREERKRLAPVSGFDLVFSCPKSVSLLHALSEDERVRREISEAHEQAWQAALAYLEREACVVRRGHAGAVREHAEGFVAAAFRHRTSRAQDPHLHAHVIVANMARGADGAWRALDGKAILRTYRLAAGYLYEAQLRHELSRRLGLSWTQPVKGMADLEGVPQEAIRAFSTRRQSLLEYMEALGTEGFAAARVAALATREAKEQVELPRLRAQWQAQAAEHGLGRRELRALVNDHPHPACVDREELAARLFAADGLTEKQTTFTLPQLVCQVAASFRDGASVAQVLDAADELSRLPDVELLNPGTAGRPPRFSTRELLALEQEALALASAGQELDQLPRPDRTLVARTLIESGLTNEQRTFVREAASRPDRIVCVVGAAGAGKTTALRLLVDIYRESGIPVLGAAPSGRAADELTNATDIASSTLHRLLGEAQTKGGLPHGCVLLVDEAGMAETRVLAPLLELVDRAEGKAILIGDPCQLPAVGAGGLYPALCDRLGAITLTDNRRQHDPTERQALARLRAGDPEPYLAQAARSGRLQQADEAIAVKQRLLQDWWKVAQHDLPGTVMLAYRRADVRDLNDAARTLLIRAGHLAPEAVELGGREFRVGDRVVCRRNDPRLGVRNGTRATVVDSDDTALTLRSDTGAQRHVTTAYAAEYLEHGYALTGHAAQGATVERAYVLLPDHGALQEWGYVACTRARTETRLYLAAETHESEAHGREPAGHGAPERAARALATTATEPLALEHTGGVSDATARAHTLRRQQLQQLRTRAEQRLANAEAKLERLGWRDRRKHGAQIRADIALQQAALRLADEKLAQPLHATRPRLGPDHHRSELTRDRSQQPRRQRATPERTHKLERERGLER